MFAESRHMRPGLLGTMVTFAAVGFFGLVGCAESPTVPDTIGALAPIRISVSWQHRTPQANDLRRMWGFSDGSFYAVGDAGTVLHFDGVTWTLMDTPVRADLHGIWAGSPDDVYVAGFDGTLLHYDGAGWEIVTTPAAADLYAVWVNAPDDLFITGMGGSVWNRFDGVWTEYEAAPGRRLRALWGYAHDEVYVCGSDATLLRFDGSAWVATGLGPTGWDGVEFRDLWGPSSGLVSVLAGFGLVWNDQGTWNNFLREAHIQHAHGSWGLSLDNQVLVAPGLSTHLTDGVESYYSTPTAEPYYDVWGPANDNYYAIGRSGHIAHFDGTGWQALSAGSVSDVRDLCMTPASAIAVGAEGLVMRQNGTQWTEENLDAGYDLWGVWEGSGLAVAVGRYAPNGRDWRPAILMNAGASWTDMGVVGEEHRLFDVWGSAPNDVYAVGWAGEVLHYNGNTWGIAAHGSGEAAFLRSIDGTSADNVFAVGRTDDLRGLICRFDGTTWTQTMLGDVEELNAVWAESETSAFAVGSLGVIRRFDGTDWQTMSSPTQETLLSVWGTHSSDFYAAGWYGTLLHYDGTQWTALLPATNRNLNAIAGRSSSEIFFAGDRGAVLFFEGSL